MVSVALGKLMDHELNCKSVYIQEIFLFLCFKGTQFFVVYPHFVLCVVFFFFLNFIKRFRFSILDINSALEHGYWCQSIL